MKPNAGFHFEPRDKLPVLQIKVELNYLLTQRSGQRISVQSQSSLSVDLPHFFPSLQCFFLILLSPSCDLLRLDYQGKYFMNLI